MIGKGHRPEGQTQNGSGLPIVTNTPDQTKNQVVLLVEHPTKPYQDPCSRCESGWCIWIGLPTLTTVPIWAGHRHRRVLPTLTSRGVKYTHNDRDNDIPHPDSGPTRIRLIPQEHIQEVIPVGDGGAKHRYIDPPTAWHSVADPHAVATIPQGGPPGLDPTTAPIEAYDVYSGVEADNFGKDFLRMAGIAQMLHAHTMPNDKYPYAHPKRVRTTQQARNPRRLDASP